MDELHVVHPSEHNNRYGISMVPCFMLNLVTFMDSPFLCIQTIVDLLQFPALLVKV